jgi:hypothetical protein
MNSAPSSGEAERVDGKDSSGLARVLGACWAEQMLLTLLRRKAPIPRLWPGTKAQARRLASAYCEYVDEREQLASEIQRMALIAWPDVAGAAANDRSASVASHA